MSIYIKGNIDSSYRCRHYKEQTDIVAIKFYCCGKWYPCHSCHDEFEDHEIVPWPRDLFNTEALICGACKKMMTISEYLSADSVCPGCGAPFNPGCSLHRNIYFR